MREWNVQKIGNPRGLIALYLDETEAIDLAHLYGYSDSACDELLQAVERAYPKPDANEDRPGVEIVLRPDEHGRLLPGFRIT